MSAISMVAKRGTVVPLRPNLEVATAEIGALRTVIERHELDLRAFRVARRLERSRAEQKIRDLEARLARAYAMTWAGGMASFGGGIGYVAVAQLVARW